MNIRNNHVREVRMKYEMMMTVAVKVINLRTVPPFVTAQAFCASRVWSGIFGFLRNLPTKTAVFLRDL